MGTLSIGHGTKVSERIAAARASLPYIINIHEKVIEAHDSIELGRGHRDYLGDEQYIFNLFEFPAGTSKKMAAYRIRRSGGEPANPAHMLAFAEQAFKDNNSFGKFHSYVIGLGGEMQTVLGAQFGGLNFGTCFFFQHLPQNRWTHDGGKNNRFLGVRRLPS